MWRISQETKWEEEMKPSCGWCTHYCQKSEIVTTGQRNVSGKLAKYLRWSKHRCNLKQEDRYPNNCDFEENIKLRDELNRKYPDLAAASVRLENVAKKVAEIKRKINEAVNC